VSADSKSFLQVLLSTPEQVSEVPTNQIPGLLARLAGLQGILLARLLAEAGPVGNREEPPVPDRLLTVEEAAPILGVTARWLYRHAASLPFARKLSRKALRFSETGLRRWLSTKRP